MDWGGRLTPGPSIQIKTQGQDFPGGPGAKTELITQEARIRPLVRELDPTC